MIKTSFKSTIFFKKQVKTWLETCLRNNKKQYTRKGAAKIHDRANSAYKH